MSEQDEMKSESAPEEPSPPAEEAPRWEFRQEFRLVGEMKKVINLAIDVSEGEIVRLQRQLEKLRYGS